jgi:hypothetical protein
MMNRSGLALLGLALWLAGCTSMPPMSGSTVAQGQLKSDVFRMLPSYAAATTGCREGITHIHTEIVQAPESARSNDRGHLTVGVIQERWLLTLCGKQQAVYITFTPDGRGGSYLSFSRKPGSPSRK